jgi:hypothetical protein
VGAAPAQGINMLELVIYGQFLMNEVPPILGKKRGFVKAWEAMKEIKG